MKLPDGYRLPEGTAMSDVRQLDQELLVSEGLEVQGLQAKKSHEEPPPGE